MKRLTDILLSIIAIIMLLPIFFVVGLVIYISDKGPVLFKQKRVGLNGREFGIYKFRSMVTHAEELGGFSTEKEDPRITSVGRWIRKTSIDELPQLINILVGDMSLVGPRPDVPAQKMLYTDREWKLRNSVRPGITGLAQATLRSEATIEQRKAMDLQYVQKVTFINDLKIIILTVRQVFAKGGN